MDPLSLAKLPVTVIWQVIQAIFSFFSSPQMQIVKSETLFRRQENKRVSLFLTVQFRNESNLPFLIRSLRVKYGGTWYSPVESLPSPVSLLSEHGLKVSSLDVEENIVKTPQIPPMNLVKRIALFRLNEPGEMFPEALEITLKATFARGRDREIRRAKVDNREWRSG